MANSVPVHSSDGPPPPYHLHDDPIQKKCPDDEMEHGLTTQSTDSPQPLKGRGPYFKWQPITKLSLSWAVFVATGLTIYCVGSYFWMWCVVDKTSTLTGFQDMSQCLCHVGVGFVTGCFLYGMLPDWINREWLVCIGTIDLGLCCLVAPFTSIYMSLTVMIFQFGVCFGVICTACISELIIIVGNKALCYLYILQFSCTVRILFISPIFQDGIDISAVINNNITSVRLSQIKHVEFREKNIAQSLVFLILGITCLLTAVPFLHKKLWNVDKTQKGKQDDEDFLSCHDEENAQQDKSISNIDNSDSHHKDPSILLVLLVVLLFIFCLLYSVLEAEMLSGFLGGSLNPARVSLESPSLTITLYAVTVIFCGILGTLLFRYVSCSYLVVVFLLMTTVACFEMLVFQKMSGFETLTVFANITWGLGISALMSATLGWMVHELDTMSRLLISTIIASYLAGKMLNAYVVSPRLREYAGQESVYHFYLGHILAIWIVLFALQCLVEVKKRRSQKQALTNCNSLLITA